ncbi:hypothetical protein PLESTF_001084400 [Pleodorina starrii]|nr:hypothetical protein PLESTF_001084400 [Pleodorina starrii]
MADLADDAGGAPLALRSLHIRHKYLGKENEATVFALNTLARVLDSNAAELADRLYRQALNLMSRLEALDGTQRTLTLEVKRCYSAFLRRQGAAPARLLEGQAAAQQAALQPAASLDLSWWEWDVPEQQQHPGGVGWEQQQHPEQHREQQLEAAEGLLVEAAESSKELLGERHPFTAVMRYVLAGVRSDRGKLQEAAGDYRAMLQAATDALGAQHYYTRFMQIPLACCLVKLGEYQEAEKLLRAVMEEEGKVPGGEGTGIHGEAQVNLADCLGQQERCREAEELYRQLLNTGREGEQVFEEAKVGLAKLLATSKQPDE